MPARRQTSTSAADSDWELDPCDIAFHEKIASGAFGDLFRGTYCGQDVAIKILRNVHDDTQQVGGWQSRETWARAGSG